MLTYKVDGENVVKSFFFLIPLFLLLFQKTKSCFYFEFISKINKKKLNKDDSQNEKNIKTIIISLGITHLGFFFKYNVKKKTT